MNANVAWRHNEEYSKVCHNKSIEPAKFDKKKKMKNIANCGCSGDTKELVLVDNALDRGT